MSGKRHPPGRFSGTPYAKVGDEYSGNLLREVLREHEHELHRLRSLLNDAGLESGGAGIAPDNEPYVLISSSSGLSAERVLTGTSRISITDGGANSSVTVDAVGAALTRVDDTNVTLTLGGSATTALVNAASLTLGWSGQLGVTRGGTALASYTVGDLLHATGTTTLAGLADVATGNVLLSGGVGVVPAYGKVGLTTHISGTLAVGNGGTGLTTGTSGGVPYFSASNTIASSGALTANGVVYGGGAGVTPAATAAGTSSQVLIGGTPPSFGSVPAAALDTDLQEIATVANVRGDLLVTNSGPTWVRLALGATAGMFLRSDATDAGWSTTTLPNSATTGDLLHASTSNTYTNLADVATGNVLLSGGVGVVPSYGKVGLTTHVSGTLAVTNGGTGLATLAQGDVLYASASNTLSALTKSASATRYLSNTGASNNPAWAQVDLTNGVTGILPVANGGTGSSAGAFVDTAFSVIGSVTASRTFKFELDSDATANADARILWAGASDMDFTLPFATGTIAITNPANVSGQQLWLGAHLFDGGDATNPAQMEFVFDASSGFFPFSWQDKISGFKVQVGVDTQTVTDCEVYWPNMAGSTTDRIVLSNVTQTLQNKTLGSSCIVRTVNATTGFSYADNTTTTKRLRHICSGLTASTNNSMTFIGTAVRDWQFEDCTGSLAITGNENKTTATNAASNRVAKFNLTGQVANIAATNLTTTTAAGFYQINAAMTCTTGSGGAGSLNFNITWTGDGGSKTATPIGGFNMVTTGSFAQSTNVVHLSSGNITFTVTGYTAGTSPPPTATYALRIRCTYLGP